MKHQQDSIPSLVTGASRTRRQPSSSSSSPPGRASRARRPVRRRAEPNEAGFQNQRTNMESPLRLSLEYHRECVRSIIDDALALLIDDNSLSIHDDEEQLDEQESTFFVEDEEDAFSPDRPAGAPN